MVAARAGKPGASGQPGQPGTDGVTGSNEVALKAQIADLTQRLAALEGIVPAVNSLCAQAWP